jgi:integrase/recombinase XerD
MFKKGADIREVSEFLGHRRIKNTEIYTHIFPDNLKEVVEKSHPREREFKKEK